MTVSSPINHTPAGMMKLRDYAVKNVLRYNINDLDDIRIGVKNSFIRTFELLLDLSDGEVRRMCSMYNGILPDGINYKFVYNDNCQHLNVYTNPSSGMIGCPSLFDNKMGKHWPMATSVSVDNRDSGVFSLVGSPKNSSDFCLFGCDCDGVAAGSIVMNDLSGSPEKCMGVFQLNDVRLSSLKGAPKQVGVKFEINSFMEDDLSALKEIDTDIKAPTITIRGSSILRDGSPVSRNNTVNVSDLLRIEKKIILGPAFLDPIIVSANNTDKKKLVSILGPKVTL